PLCFQDQAIDPTATDWSSISLRRPLLSDADSPLQLQAGAPTRVLRPDWCFLHNDLPASKSRRNSVQCGPFRFSFSHQSFLPADCNIEFVIRSFLCFLDESM